MRRLMVQIDVLTPHQELFREVAQIASRGSFDRPKIRRNQINSSDRKKQIVRIVRGRVGAAKYGKGGEVGEVGEEEPEALGFS